MNKYFNKTSFAGLVAAASLAIFSSCGSKENQATTNAANIKAVTNVAQVIEYPAQYSFSGKLEADKQANLSTRMMGQIERVLVTPGQKVKAGDLLVQIRAQDIQAKKAQVEASQVEAKTAFESAQKDLKRFEALYANKSASDKEMDDMRTRFEMAKARLDAVNQMQNEVNESFRYTSIRAPYNGVITGKFVNDGDMANPGMPLLSIESPGQWKVIARIPESDIANLKLNDPVKVQFSSVAGLQILGTISEINPSSTNTGAQFEAKIALNTNPSQNTSLYSGMYATVIYENGTQPIMLIPQNALVKRGQLEGLYTVSQSGTSLLRWIRTGKAYGDSIEVLSGLNDGEKYILSSESKLYDGAIVENK